MNEFLEQFLIESRELVEQAADDLLALEQTPDDRARLDSAFRAFHTLKGAAGIVEFAAMARAVHAAEDVLAAVRAGDHPVTADLVSNCLACLDQIMRWLAVMEATEEAPADADASASELVAAFALPEAPILVDARPAAVTDGLPAWVGRLIAASPDGAAARVAILYTPDPDCFFRGDDPLALIAGTPGLLTLRVEPVQPWQPLDEMDAFACNLVIQALADSPMDRVAAVLGRSGTAARLLATASSISRACDARPAWRSTLAATRPADPSRPAKPSSRRASASASCASSITTARSGIAPASEPSAASSGNRRT